MSDLPEPITTDWDTMAQVEQLTETVNALIAYIAERDGVVDPEEEQ